MSRRVNLYPRDPVYASFHESEYQLDPKEIIVPMNRIVIHYWMMAEPVSIEHFSQQPRGFTRVELRRILIDDFKNMYGFGNHIYHHYSPVRNFIIEGIYPD